MLRRYRNAGDPVSCEPVAQGLLNRGYRLRTTHGAYFLKHHLDGDHVSIARQHRATQRLQKLGVPVAPPVESADGDTVAVIGGRCYALHPWIEGRHRDGAELTADASRRLGGLLGLVHTRLDEVMEPSLADSPATGPAYGATAHPAAGPATGPANSPTALSRLSELPYLSPDPADTLALIDELLLLARGRTHADVFDRLAEHRLVERRGLLERHAHRRPPPGAVPATGWVHGDFHPLNLLYRGAEPAAIVDWDRLGVQPRAEEVVRAAAIFFVRPTGELELTKVRAYARAYRSAAGTCAAELAAAVHRVWWERLNDFWILRWRYQLDDRRADPLFAAVSALAVWWTREYDAVCEAFAG
ncbi:aminoglycoside phosphotransferase [Streptomyces paludis]|uniref:Aminoglycoside phosphotransferase n=1 Tax=Streptomyces paludis TaxID=2282738 RepID=A0A345I106_9ACTN|nr:phosphotransferase [Streptomyces paludis]AXG82630.1 aminoglycoside phosphotransferase [Streptomyces paludis]